MKSGGQAFVYILLCADGAYYVGATQDVSQRINTHNAGNGPAFTAARLPVRLMHVEPFASMAEARQREMQIKRWSRAKKLALIAGDATAMHTLSRRRGK